FVGHPLTVKIRAEKEFILGAAVGLLYDLCCIFVCCTLVTKRLAERRREPQEAQVFGSITEMALCVLQRAAEAPRLDTGFDKRGVHVFRIRPHLERRYVVLLSTATFARRRKSYRHIHQRRWVVRQCRMRGRVPRRSGAP